MEWHEKHDSEDSASAAGRKLFGFYFKNWTISLPHIWSRKKEKGQACL
jgi:hypothetical protein